MTVLYSNIGQALPAAGALTDLTAGGVGQIVVSTVVACNTGNTPAKIRISNPLFGAADSLKQYLVYDDELAANETKTFTLGISINNVNEILRCYSANGQVAFNAYGMLKF